MIIPPKLKAGDDVRIITPSCTLPSIDWMNDEFLDRTKKYFSDLGLTVSEGTYIRELNEFGSTTIEHRIADLHDAFRDPSVKALITIRGGWNSNQLLPYLDYDLIKKNPKILCGFSDITALGNAITAKTGLVTYSGPNFASLTLGSQIAYTFEYLQKCLFSGESFEVHPSKEWTDDKFLPEHQELIMQKNEGWWMIHEGDAEGTSLGGNLCTLSLLQGTQYMPDAEDIILFIEDDHETHPRTFDRDLVSLTQQPMFQHVRGILIGRCQPQAVNEQFGAVTKEMLFAIIANNPLLKKIPIIANLDFGHTHPIITFPIGGRVRMKAGKKESRIEIIEH